MPIWEQTPRKNVQLVIRPGENAAYDMMLLRYKRKVELFVTMRVVWAFIELFQGKMSFWRSCRSCNLKHFHFVFALSLWTGAGFELIQCQLFLALTLDDNLCFFQVNYRGYVSSLGKKPWLSGKLSYCSV